MPRSRAARDHRLERPLEGGGRHHEQRRRVRPGGVDPALEGLAERAARRGWSVDRGDSVALVLRQHRRQLTQRQRVAEREREDGLDRLPGELGVGQQGEGVRSFEPAQRQLVEPPAGAEQPRLALGPRGDQHGRARALEPAAGVGEALGGRAVEPVRVVDDDQQRALAGGGPDHAEEAGEGGQTLVDDLLGHGQRERRRDRRRLWRRQLVQPGEQRGRELAERRERQLRLRLDPGGAGEQHALGPLPGCDQERRLADPGLAAYQQSAAAAVTRAIE